MIRFFIFISFGFVTFSAFAQKHDEKESEHHCLYEEKSLTKGIAIPYSFELNTVEVNARMYYNLGETICFGPEYSYFKTNETQVVDFDFIGHYIFEIPWVGIYPLSGVNYTLEKELENNETIADTGIVFGASVHQSF